MSFHSPPIGWHHPCDWSGKHLPHSHEHCFPTCLKSGWREDSKNKNKNWNKFHLRGRSSNHWKGPATFLSMPPETDSLPITWWHVWKSVFALQSVVLLRENPLCQSRVLLNVLTHWKRNLEEGNVLFCFKVDVMAPRSSKQPLSSLSFMPCNPELVPFHPLIGVTWCCLPLFPPSPLQYSMLQKHQDFFSLNMSLSLTKAKPHYKMMQNNKKATTLLLFHNIFLENSDQISSFPLGHLPPQGSTNHPSLDRKCLNSW